MKLDRKALIDLCDIAREAASAAGRLIAERRGSGQELEFKSTGGGAASQVVTETDRLSQELIAGALASSIERFDLGFLGEETADDDSRLRKDNFWCVDPLDGTLPYSEGKSGFAVSIALVTREGEPVVGVIHDPAGNVLYHAVHGLGAFKNGEPFRRPEGSTQTFSLAVDRSFLEHERFASRLEGIKNIVTRNGLPDLEVLPIGGAVMNACYVLEHPPACYLKFPRSQPGGGSLWDYAASAALFREAGAQATDFMGAPMDLNRPDSTFMNHRGILFASDERIAAAFRSALA